MQSETTSAPTAIHNGPLLSLPQSSEQSHNQSDAMDVDLVSRIVTTLARERVRAELIKSQPQTSTRKPRTCRKCAKHDCGGKKSVDLCRNPCQDCGRITGCRGQNPKRMGGRWTCNVAWEPL